MNHTDAIETGAAERYLLDEMTAEERERFEEHYFTCRECGEGMRAAASLIDGIRAIGAERSKVVQLPARKPFLMRTPSWIPAAAAAVLALVVSYQSLVIIPGLRDQSADARQVSVFLLRPETRGDARQVVRAPGQPIVVSLDVPMAPASREMEAVVQTPAGGAVATSAVTLPEGEGRAFVMLPAKLSPALYTIVLRSAGNEIGRYQFDLVEQAKGAK
jgi:hypothetical protein